MIHHLAFKFGKLRRTLEGGVGGATRGPQERWVTCGTPASRSSPAAWQAAWPPPYGPALPEARFWPNDLRYVSEKLTQYPIPPRTPLWYWPPFESRPGCSRIITRALLSKNAFGAKREGPKRAITAANRGCHHHPAHRHGEGEPPPTPQRGRAPRQSGGVYQDIYIYI